MLYLDTWRRTALAVFFLAAAVALAAAPAHAGRSCEAHKPTPQLIERGMQLAQQTAAALDAEFARSGSRVVVLGRAGQDLGKYGLRYSHLGWAYRTSEGPWRVVHKLNDCGTAVGHLYRQGLGEFFSQTESARFEMQIVLDNARARTLQHPPYSMVSYVWGRKYQQSNQWALETLAVAMEPASVRTRDQAQAWLQFRGYEPSVLKIGALTRLGGRVGSANIAFDDHPNDKRFADRIETVTVDSVLAWLARARLASTAVTLRLEN